MPPGQPPRRAPGETGGARGVSDVSLPYDPGNAGDLLKHGWLAEWAAWWCARHPSLTFLDPFAGLPWIELSHPEVARRDKR